ncbi:Ig-like domain-containing protein [Chitiniphilus shinanonensis]|uniref:Ig-like domain-containing protein n=1 Tax=Chitiniphilus shinanonensis TaxID=553088 RepID=UPI00304FBE24
MLGWGTISAADLTVLDDVVVKFGRDAQLVVRDKLVAGKGSVFTGRADASVGAPLTASEPAVRWRGVRVEKSAAASLKVDGATFRQASDAGLTVRGAAPAMTSLRFADNAIGLRLLDAAAPRVGASSFLNNGVGVSAEGGSLPEIVQSQFAGNTQYALFNADPTRTVQALGNWWGHGSGPTVASNPAGQGDAISAGVAYGGALAAAPLLNPSISLAHAASYFEQPTVDLVLHCENATEYRIAEDGQFAGVPFKAMGGHADTVAHTVSAGDGSKSLTVQFRNAAGALATAELAAPLLIDTLPPTLAFANPEPGSVISAPVMLEATAQDSAGIARIEFFVDEVLAASLTQPPFQHAWDASKAEAGRHELKVVAHDAVGRTSALTHAVTVEKLADIVGGTIPAKMNLYGAGHATAPGGGVLPFKYEFAPGADQEFRFTGIQGQVAGKGGDQALAGADGGDAVGERSTAANAGLSGISHTKAIYLAGVFLDDSEPTGTAPATLDFAGNTGFATLAPQLRQVFFIGDGLTGTGDGDTQVFIAPPTATRLYLGFVDSCSNRGGAAGCYNDNVGELTVTVARKLSQQPDAAGPEMSNLTLAGQAFTAGLTVARGGVLQLEAIDRSGVSRVEMLVDTDPIPVRLVRSGLYAADLDITALANGSHTLTIRAYDSLDHRSEQSVAFEVAHAAPEAPVFSAPAAGSITRLPHIDVAGTGKAGAQVQLFVNGQPAGDLLAVGDDGRFGGSVALQSGVNRIQASVRDQWGTSPLSSELLVTYDATVPTRPDNLAAIQQQDGKVRLSWASATDPNVRGFDVYRSTAGFDDLASASRINDKLLTTNGYDDMPASDGRYFYRVVAVGTNGALSAPSNQVEASVDSTPPRAVRVAYASQGYVDSVTGRFGQGLVQVELEVTEALLVAPYLAVVPQGGQPVTIELQRIDDTHYRGSFPITAATPAGTANVLFSARDLVGNRGTEIGEGATLKIDTAGPVLTAIELAPAAPIRNDAQSTITATFTFDKAMKQGVAPQLWYRLSGPLRSATEIGDVSALSPTSWRASFTLPADAGQGTPEVLTFSVSGRDDLDNVSTRITASNSFQVYHGELPPAAVPLALTAKAQPGGKVLLGWQAVDEAFAYQLYRQAPGETELTALARASAPGHLDATPRDGHYRYAIASLRQSNGQERLSDQSAPVDVTSSATAPGAPQGLTLELTGQGIVARWQAPLASQVDHYRLYRGTGMAITSLEGKTPLFGAVRQTLVVDADPSATEHAYVVTAVDAAGNESAMSNSAYLNATLLPVPSLSVEQLGKALPKLSWGASRTPVAGYHVYLDVAGAPSRLTAEPLNTQTYTDTGYTTGPRRYTVAAVDGDGMEMKRSIQLPDVALQIAGGLPLKRGVMNRLQVQVSNVGDSALAGAKVVIRLDGKRHLSDTFSLAVNETRLIPVIVGGYAQLPAQAAAEVVLEQTPNQGEQVTLAQDTQVEVADGALVVGMATADFTRGGTGKVRLTIENTSDVEVELLTARNSGKEASSELRFKLVDGDGNVLATEPYRQAIGAGVVTLTNGETVARIPAGARYASDEFQLSVPAGSPQALRVVLEVDRLRYHSGQPDQVVIAGRGSERMVSLIDTAYYGELTQVGPVNSFGDEDIVIQGRALDRQDNAPLSGVRLTLVLNQQGFERTFPVLTDSNGEFSHRFTPTSGDAGLYKVSAIHPDMTDRPEQKGFTIHRVKIGPTPVRIDLPKNYAYTVPFVAKAGIGTQARNLRFVLNPASQPTGQLPMGVSLTLPAPVDLAERQSLNMPVKFVADNSALTTGSVILDVISDEHAQAPVAQARIDYTLSESKPFLVSQPSMIQTGLAQGSVEVESVQVQNKGLQEALNLQFTLTRTDGSAAPGWMSIANQPNGTLDVGEARSIDLRFAPAVDTPQGLYELQLHVAGDNVPKQALNVYASVTQSGIGSVLFKAADIFTATLNKQGQLIPGLARATITLQNEDVVTVTHELVTDSLGEALFKDLPAGRYKYRVRAADHQEVGGRLTIKPGITATQPVFLDYNLISVEWQVREVTIQDRYDIVLTTTFETDVPAAVIVLQPASVNLPPMGVGDVYHGELSLTNHGLVRADDVQLQLPGSDGYFKYEFLADIPDTLDAKQRVTIPYRIVALKALDDAAGGEASGAGCYNYSNTLSATCQYECANGNRSKGGSATSWFSSSNSTCTGGSNTSSTHSTSWWAPYLPDGFGGWGGGSASTPMKLKGKKCVFIPNGSGPTGSTSCQ